MGEEEKEQQERREKAAQELSEHDRIMTRNAAHAARDTLHDASAHHEPGAYTTYEARERAAHTPSILDRDGPRNREEEARMIDALHKELFPTDSHWEASTQNSPASSRGTEASQRKDFQVDASAEKPAKENTGPMTPEQQASVNKALERADLTDKTGGTSDVSANPTPNDPTSLDKSRDIGQDLHKHGVTMDKQ